MRAPRKPDPEVLETDYRVPTGIGTGAWAVALVVLVAMGDRISADDRWWLWVCCTGIVLGVFAFFYIPRLLRKRAEADERAEERHAARRAAVDGDLPVQAEYAAADPVPGEHPGPGPAAP